MISGYWSQAILFIGKAPRPQALILLKIAPAARTYGLHLCCEAFFIFISHVVERKIRQDQQNAHSR